MSKKLGLRGFKYLFLLAAVMALLVVPATVSADIYANVTINATPSYIAITTSPDNYTFGVVSTGTNYTTTEDYFNTTSTSSVNIDIELSVNNTEWVGGTPWTHSDAGTPGADTAALYASTDNFSGEIVVQEASATDLDTDIAEDASVLWELRLGSPTSFSDGEIKAITVVVEGTAHS